MFTRQKPEKGKGNKSGNLIGNSIELSFDNIHNSNIYVLWTKSPDAVDHNSKIVYFKIVCVYKCNGFGRKKKCFMHSGMSRRVGNNVKQTNNCNLHKSIYRKIITTFASMIDHRIQWSKFHQFVDSNRWIKFETPFQRLVGNETEKF